MIGVGLSIPQIAGSSTAFSPLTLFAAGEQGVWYDPSDFSTMFQDSAGTTPVTAVEQPVGLILDKSGRGNHASQATTTSRPVLKIDGSGKYYLLFDGVDDSLATASINFTSTDKMTVHAGVRKVSDAAQAMVVELSSSLGTNNGTFALQAPRTTSAGRFSFVAKGTGSGTVDANAAANASPVTAVLTSQMDIAGDATSLRVNGVSAGTSVANLGTGNLGNYPLYIGRRGGSTLPFNGRLYSLIVRGAASTNAQIVGAEKWVNGKTSAY